MTRTFAPRPDGPVQLTIDGPAVPVERVRVDSHRIGPIERLVLEELKRGPLRSWEIGYLWHEARGHCGDGAKDARYRGSGSQCCGYGSIDGSIVAKRLRDKGLVRRRFDRRWELIRR